MSKFKLCFIFDGSGDYKPVPYTRLMDNGERRDEFKDKYFLPLNGYLLEVSREDYLNHYKNVNRQEYIKKEAKRVGQISLQSMTVLDDESIRCLYEDVAEKVITEMMNVYLHNAIAMLDSSEQLLIRLLYFDEQTEQHCAEIFGVNQSTINRRKTRVLEKLRNILEA